MARGRAERRVGRAWRLFLLAAYALIVAWSWQLGLVELLEHDDGMAEECPDDEGPCDCGSNCHCCLLCAHHSAPVVEPAPADGPGAAVGVIELTLDTAHAMPAGVHHGPASKVPKHRS